MRCQLCHTAGCGNSGPLPLQLDVNVSMHAGLSPHTDITAVTLLFHQVGETGLEVYRLDASSL